MEKPQKTKKKPTSGVVEPTGSSSRCVNRTGQDRWNTEKRGRPSSGFNPPFIFWAATAGRLEKQRGGGRAERKQSGEESKSKRRARSMGRILNEAS